MPTVLSARECRPFDLVYEHVTDKIVRRANGFADAYDKKWLLHLVDAFAHERTLWNKRDELEGYRVRWLGLRTRLLRLAAGAYLHVCYDLPRAMADAWPGLGAWSAGPDEFQGEGIFHKLREVFVESFRASARRRSVVGAYALLLGFLPDSAARWFSFWVLKLRLSAWNHARVLATQGDRQRREEAMAIAMTAALKDASDLTPWSVSLLKAPDDAIWVSPGALFASLAVVLTEYGWLISLVTLLLLLLYQYHVSITRRLEHEMAFIRDFAFLVEDYVGFAIENPDGFSEYRRRRFQGRFPSSPEAPLRG